METRKSTNTIFSNISRINWRGWLPSRGNAIFTLVVIIAMFWAQSAHALPWASSPIPAPPVTPVMPAIGTSTTVWPYQGRLNNSAGTPLTAALAMTFKLYNVSSAGTALWQEQWTSVQVTGGLFNVMLGSQTAIPQSIVTGNTNLWLGITVGTDTEMTPRVQLGSVPFAGVVPDGSITTTKLTDGNVTTAKIANGAIIAAKLANETVTSAQVANGSLQSRDIHLANGKWQSSTDLTLTSNSQNIPGTEFTLNPDTPQTFLIITTADLEVTSAAGYVFLLVDGVQQTNYIAAFSSSTAKRGTLSQTYLISLNPGNHTIVLQAHKEGSGGSGNVWKQGTAITYMSVSQ